MVSTSLSGGVLEKGIRCKTGTVPAAVSPHKNLEIIATAISAGRLKTGQVRRPAMTVIN